MADIKEIDYDQIIVKASQIASAANEMQTNIKDAFTKIDSMRENWFGNSYDNFINVVNMSIPGLNKIFEVTVSDIPHEIAAKAKSYAKLLGITLGRVIYLDETSTPTSYPIYTTAGKADSAATVVDLGEQKVSVSVTVRWSIG